MSPENARRTIARGSRPGNRPNLPADPSRAYAPLPLGRGHLRLTSLDSPRLRPVLLAVFFFALLARLAVIATGAGDPIVQTPMLDAEYAVEWAHQVAKGDVWASPEGDAYFRPPLYAWFLALAFALPGPDLLAARLLQALLGAATAMLLADVAGRRFGKIAAWVTGLLAAIAWPLLHYGREFLVSPLDLFLVALMFRLWDRTTSTSGRGHWLAIGACVGAAALARPNLVAVAPVLAVVAAFQAQTARWTRGAWLLAGCAFVLAPISIRNRLVSGEWVLLATQGGVNLWIGNHPQADGMTATLPGFSSWRNEDVSAWLARERGRPVSAAQEDAYFRTLTRDRAIHDPLGFARGLLRKTYLFFQGYEIRNNRDLYAARARDALLSLPSPDFGLVGPLALLGFFAARRRARELAFLWAHGAAVALGVILVFVCARYRLAAWPAFLIFAGAGAAWIAGPTAALRTRAFRATLLVLLVALARVDFLHIRGIDWAQTHLQWGNVYARTGDDEAAEREFSEALRIQPGLAEARHHLGALHLRRGDIATALPELHAAVAAMPFSFRARRTLAEALEASGRIPAALAVRREALELSAGAPDEKLALATTLGMAGEYREAYALFREIEPVRRDDPYFLLNAGQTALMLKQEGPGIGWLTRATEFEETREAATTAIVTFHLSQKRVDEALRLLSEALLHAPESQALLRLRAQARFFAGDRTGALEDLRHLMRIDPEDPEARAGLAALERDAAAPGAAR